METETKQDKYFIFTLKAPPAYLNNLKEDILLEDYVNEIVDHSRVNYKSVVEKIDSSIRAPGIEHHTIFGNNIHDVFVVTAENVDSAYRKLFEFNHQWNNVAKEFLGSEVRVMKYASIRYHDPMVANTLEELSDKLNDKEIQRNFRKNNVVSIHQKIVSAINGTKPEYSLTTQYSF